jgi:hypothetical protein
MATAVWQPQEGELKEICGLLEQYRLPTVDQSRIWQQHQRCSQLPDFNNYLAFILCRAEVLTISVSAPIAVMIVDFGSRGHGSAAFRQSPCTGQKMVEVNENLQT